MAQQIFKILGINKCYTVLVYEFPFFFHSHNCFPDSYIVYLASDIHELFYFQMPLFILQEKICL